MNLTLVFFGLSISSDFKIYMICLYFAVMIEMPVRVQHIILESVPIILQI